MCMDCMCNEYVGHHCNTTELCGDDLFNCDLLGLPKSYWLTSGQPIVDGDDPTSEFGKVIDGNNC